MKRLCQTLFSYSTCLLALSALSPAAAFASQARALVIAGSGAKASAGAISGDDKLLIEAIEPESATVDAKQVAWLGVATEECSEALASQLGLNGGEGLLVSHVVADSPAAKVGLQKNDVLTDFDGQLLVHPAQLRKLILLHKESDKVKLTYYRSGKKETVEASIGKHAAMANNDEWRAFQGQWVNQLPMTEVHQQLKGLRESLKEAGVDKEAINVEVRRGIEEARKAIQQALRQATNAARTFGPAAREFQELARHGVDVDKDATVIVKSKHESVRSIVKTDDSGTYVIVANPKKQLTAHDKSGKLLFDGSIETPEEQDKVPREVWDRVKPMIEQLSEDKAEEENLDDKENT